MPPKTSSAALVCILAACCGRAGAARADELADLRRAVADQQERIERLEREKKPQGSGESKLIAGWDNGFFLGSADGKNKLKLRGYIQTDGRFFPDDDVSQSNQFLVRRARPILEGTLLGWIDFRLMPDFGGGNTRLYDAWANARFLGEGGKALQLRAGEDKVPFGLERLQSSTARLFAELALTTNLVPNRDIGAMVHGAELFGGRLDYQLGVYNGVPGNGISTGDMNDGKDIAARLFARPFRGTEISPLEGLGIGVAGTWGDQGHDSDLPSFRTSGQNSFFTYLGAVDPDGARYRVSPQLYWSWGPAGLLAEYVLSSERVQNGDASDRLTHEAWQAAVSYVLTGEAASFAGVTPARPFAPGSWGPGAWELVGRVHQLDVDDDAFPVFANPDASATEALAWAVGVNWYWNKWLKLVVNYEQTTFDGGAASGDRETERAVLTRLQLAF
jgi:phosphate-selective porin OprO/OprP